MLILVFALQEGVSKYSTEKQNIPWRKILEFGCRVFDKTRTPVDLKDKWKNIISKEGKITKLYSDIYNSWYFRIIAEYLFDDSI